MSVLRSLLDRRPEVVFVWVTAAQTALEWAFWLLAMIWWVVELGLSPIELVLLGVVFNIALLISEVPTGVVADLRGRKPSLIIAFTLMGLAVVLAVVSRNFIVVLAAQAMYACGWTFQSGADIAWVTSEAGRDDTGDPIDIDGLMLRRHRLGMVLGLILLPISALLGTWSVRGGVAIIGVAMTALGLTLPFLMVERHFTPGHEKGETFGSTLRSGLALVRDRPRLRTLLVAMVVFAIPSEALDRLGAKRFLEAHDWGDRLLWANLALIMAMAVAGLIGNRLATRAAEAGRSHIAVAAALFLVAAFGAVVLAMFGPVLAIAFGLLLQDGAREAVDPVIDNWVNSEAEESVQATLHSLVGQGFAVGEIAGGVALGVLATATSIPWSIAVGALALCCAAALSARAARPPA